MTTIYLVPGLSPSTNIKLVDPTAAPGATPPFIPVFLEQPKAGKQYVPDVLFNPVALAAGPSRPFSPPLIDEPRAWKQYIPDVLFNPVALAAGTSQPFSPPLIDEPTARRQYVPDILFNPVALAAGPSRPFVNPQLDQPSWRRQYVPDVLFNPVALNAGTPYPFGPPLIDGPRPGKQYVPDVFFNRAVLGVVVQPPFVTALFDQRAPRAQYIPDVAQNRIILGVAPPAPPFIPSAQEQPRRARQYRTDDQSPNLALGFAPAVAVPFSLTIFDGPRPWRQYVPDVFFNPLVPGSIRPPVPPPPPTPAPPGTFSSGISNAIGILFSPGTLSTPISPPSPAFQVGPLSLVPGSRPLNTVGILFSPGSTSAPTASPAIPVSLLIPVMGGGSPTVGEPLTIPTGAWTGSPTSFTYRWFQNGVPIVGAVSTSYVPTAADAGTTISAGVVGVNNAGAGVEAISIAVGPVKPKKDKSLMSGLNRIAVTIPANSEFAAIERDAAITNLTAMGITNWQHYHYSDTSPLGLWEYFAFGTLLSSNGIVTVATVTCSGAAHPPSGSNITANPDPGIGSVYVWAVLGYPFRLSTSGVGGGGGTAPAQNSNGYVWNIAGNSSAAAADFTAAIAAVNANMPSFIINHFFKYVDSVSGAWQVSAVWFAPGTSNPAATVAIPNSTVMYMVICSGSPNPPLGSQAPAVALPAFTQTFVTLTAPLSFGPMR
jgi:hypothetical protein